MVAIVQRECLYCKQIFDAQLREIKRGNAKFCSRKCSQRYLGQQRILNRKKVNNVSCAWCKKEFFKTECKRLAPKNGLHFCRREHKDLAQRIGGIKEIQPPHYKDHNSDYRIIAFRSLNKDKVCERCGYDKHEAAIIVHHKDRNRANNLADNLEVLCANCHAIEHWAR